MKLTFAILIAFLMIVSSSIIAFDHSNPNSAILPTLQISTLSNNPDKTVALYASGGLGNYSGTNIGKLSINLAQVGGTYQYGGKPYIASSLTPDGQSSQFSLEASGNITYYGSADTGASSSGVIYAIFTTYVTIQGQANTINTTTVQQNFEWSDSLLGSKTVSMPYQIQLVPATLGQLDSITGSYNSIVTFSVNVQILSNPENGWGFYESASFHPYNFSLQRQVLILPATASLGKPSPNPVKQGQEVSIPYSTGYAPITGNGAAYTIEVIGSPAYNGGKVLKTYQVGQNIQNGLLSYTTPNNSFVPSSNLQANQFKVILFDNWFPLISSTFFTIDNYSYEPPAPTISIVNSPSNGVFVMGNFYTLRINYTVNSITQEPIHYIDLWIYSASQSDRAAQFIVNDYPIPVTTQGNGSVEYTFQLSYNPNSLWIQAQSVDYQGRASQQQQISISSLDIHSPNATAPPSTYITIIISAVIAVVGSVLIFLIPIDYLSRGILIFSWVLSVLIILNSYVPGLL